VVFARFKHDLAVIREEAKARGWLDGEKSGTVDDMEKWQMGDVNLLATQLQAGGVGIDLTRARYCIYYGHDYNMGNYNQSRARVHRPGQTRPVTYVHLIAERSIDEDILTALEKRESVNESVMNGLWRG
jgi:SNF2 family DNA or RNA helicase